MKVDSHNLDGELGVGFSVTVLSFVEEYYKGGKVN